MGAVSRTLEILLADWEISFNTQVKNRACVPCMAEQTGVHDVIFHAEGRAYVSDHALELILPIVMPPRACAVHARHIHARRWQFRLNPADNAAYTPRYTDAQPCRPAPRMLQKAKFA